MNYTEYQKAFSCARLNKYLIACSGNTMAALTLYHNNVKLCQKFYEVLNVFEVVLEAICFNASGVKSTAQAKEYYELVIKYIQFLGYSESRLFYGFDVLPNKMLNKIDSL